jgi:hypothetical protein
MEQLTKNKKLPQGSIIQLDNQLNPIISEASQIKESIMAAVNAQTEQRKHQNDLLAEIDALAVQMGVSDKVHTPTVPLFQVLDCELEDFYSQQSTNVKQFPSITPAEWIYSAVAGILSVAVDIVLVGTPRVVKMFKGGESFDGSKLTAQLRSLGGDKESNAYAVGQWLSNKCKVPYDLSAKKGVMIPNNHRIRSLGHDPLFGLFFAVADILMGTTTCIDNAGHLRVLVGKHQSTGQEKLLSVLYYIGHLFSDIGTARGIPVPGFFMTQFFTRNGDSSSVAKAAERMYKDGYDMRHLASASVPVGVKNLLIDGYLTLSDIADSSLTAGIAQTEIKKQNAVLKREKMLFIADCVATGGNLGKVLLPPSCGNLASINLAQWGQLIKSSIVMTSALTRDRSVETVTAQRKEIDTAWEKLNPL